ncbi:MAG: ferrous iron transport protein B [Acholeplasmataceae bacterium]
MKIALVGNQNSGKTTLFNLLTGTNQKIGNWPGVTIEKKTGILRGSSHEITDLPGIYSLSPYSLEEEISRKYLFEEDIDLIVNIIDSTSIERSLYLTTQLLELDIPVIIAMNMSDLVTGNGIEIDLDVLEEALDTTLIPISALKKTGIIDLIEAINSRRYRPAKDHRIFDEELEEALFRIEAELEGAHRRFLAVNLVEEDPRFVSYRTPVIEGIVAGIRKRYDRDMEQAIADGRYRYIERLRDEAIRVTHEKQTMTDRLDAVFLNRIFAIPIFMVIMFTVYYLAAGPIGGWTVGAVEVVFESISERMTVFLENVGASPWSRSLVVDGMIAGVGAVLGFVPQLMILFLLISLLETSGYMSRISFFLDKLFQRVGLSGKSLIPFIIGSGCSVPAIMSARTITDEKEKKMTIMLTPFIPCSAKLPIITLFAGYFFENNSGLVSASLYFMSIAIILFSAFILKKVLFRSRPSSYISELPKYKLPSARYVAYDVSGKTLSFIKNAGSIILIVSIVVWFLISFSWDLTYGVDTEASMLASIGNAISFLFYPMLGEMSWGASVSALQGLIAKEQVISSMAIIAGFSEQSSGLLIFGSETFAFFTPASAYAFMAFNLFSAPCFGAIAAMQKELGSTKEMLLAVLYQTGLAWMIAVVIFQVGRLLSEVS